MEHGQVRTILWRHAAGTAILPADLDPNSLTPVDQLQALLGTKTTAEQRRLGADYATLWSRTFRTLVAHLKGRPDRALSLFAEEVYPFLRGNRLAARLERAGRRQARLLLADDLPAEYLAGMAGAFVELSGARAHATSHGAGVLVINFETPATQRVARIVAHATALRLPLLACALLATLTGAALALVVEPIDLTLFSVTLAGVLGAQIGANSLQGLRHGPPHPFAPGQAARSTFFVGVGLGYAVAAVAALWLVRATSPAILGFAAIGLALGLAYARFRERGYGPAIAAMTYGLLIPAGVVVVLQPGVLASPIAVVLIGAPLGLMGAAMLLLDNLADRPLDEAGGQRTLAVRLPPQRNGVVYAGLVGLAIVWLVLLSISGPNFMFLVTALVLAGPGVILAKHVHKHLADPHALAGARLANFALLVAVSLMAILIFVAVAA